MNEVPQRRRHTKRHDEPNELSIKGIHKDNLWILGELRPNLFPCQQSEDSRTISDKGDGMKRGFRGFAGRFWGTEIVLVAVSFLVLFPSSASILCIAPGSHIAIESINAKCCASDRVLDPAATHAHNELGLTGNCGNCTDLFLAPYGREAIPKSHCDAASSSQADEFLGNQPPVELSLSQFRPGAIRSIGGPNPFSSSLPLRC
jgi:hypothetical protein